MSILFSKSLKKNIPIPYYYQLKEILLEYITEHHVNQDVQIPTELEISKHFSISRPTVRQAMNELVVEGYLYRQKGKGTFIIKPKISQSFLQVLDSFNNEMIKKGLKPTTTVLSMEVKKSDEKVSEKLKLPLDSQVIQLRRLRYANEEPIVYVVTYLPYSKCSLILEKDLQHESLYEILEQECGLCLLKATRELEAVIAGDYEAALLQIDIGSPLQYIKSITYLADEAPIEYSLAKYRGNRSKFSFELTK
ncbi:GntR family transcriptional regulator [Paenibacillus psychroresistens]|uniref:GntR family transcriptional regulator n=1 Tax=Paenibacillus psychroresistens TaxID=1778678 RepID=A0A6B8RJE5_9BACL|nr:GntR family transcriptional regulator [Paenibacillus psychroresistens]QGQ96380.1 GntR family transcriptional regulator [Paenibacillus psychroresistens]